MKKHQLCLLEIRLIVLGFIKISGSLSMNYIHIPKTPLVLNDFEIISFERQEPNRLKPTELFLGEKVLIYLHINDLAVFNTFW